MSCVDNDDMVGLSEILNHLPPEVPITSMANEDGFTLLHRCAFQNKKKPLDIVLKIASQKNTEIKEFVNARTIVDEFQAIHYASFRGNVKICQALLNHGADKECRNKHGLNVLHIAAQGDQPVSLYYFHKIEGMSIIQQDERGSTPLHWAVFSCSELALIFILSWVGINDVNELGI